jgi:hypothetical protein
MAEPRVAGCLPRINLARGWLFSAARGLHQQRRLAVMSSLFPLAGDHLASLTLVVAPAGVSAHARSYDLTRMGAANGPPGVRHLPAPPVGDTFPLGGVPGEHAGACAMAAGYVDRARRGLMIVPILFDAAPAKYPSRGQRGRHGVYLTPPLAPHSLADEQ